MPAAPVTVDRRMLGGIAFLTAVNEALQAYGTFNSSPQTTELFASAREKTLIKWVRIGSANALAFGAIGAWISRSFMPLLGTVLVIVELEWLYRYAAKCGKEAAATPGAPPAGPASPPSPLPDAGGRPR